jgi:hypothetical protein
LTIEKILNSALTASDASSFMRGIQEGFSFLSQELLGKKRKEGLLNLQQAFERSQRNVRQRKVLELCAWPIFDKPGLSAEDGQTPEFLWLFALPFEVTFPLSALDAPIFIHQDILDAEKMLDCLEASDYLTPNRNLRIFSSLYRKDDIHFFGPQHIAEHFVKAEEGDLQDLHSLPIVFDEEIESCRTVTLLALCAARCRLGEVQTLLNRQATWDPRGPEALVANALNKAGYPVEKVESLPPCSMAEALFHCTGAGYRELELNVLEAVKLYQPEEILVKYPMEGFAEINAITADKEEISLIPAFSFCEPREELTKSLKKICQDHRIAYGGAFALASPASACLH